jgi:zinc and cadmium transporter
MASIILYIIASVLVVSLISLIGIFSVIGKKQSKHFLMLMVSLSAGTLFGGAFLHLLPEAVEKAGSFTLEISLLLLLGVIVFFILEKFIHWKHCHGHEHDDHHECTGGHSHNKKSQAKNTALAPLNLFGDAIHNLLDGVVIAAAYFVSIPAGIATTIAVILHEVPQEIADFGVLLYSGMKKWKALLFNFLTAAVSIIGALIVIAFSDSSHLIERLILPFAAGGFVYIAGSNLIPELHKDCNLKDSIWHFVAMLGGLLLMVALKYLAF